MRKKALSLIPLFVFLILIIVLGYLIWGGDRPGPAETATPLRVAAAVTNTLPDTTTATRTATANATQTAQVAAAATTAAEATLLSQETATAEAATSAAATAMAGVQATETTVARGTATGQARSTAAAAETATAANKATGTAAAAESATAEAITMATMATATAEAQAAAMATAAFQATATRVAGLTATAEAETEEAASFSAGPTPEAMVVAPDGVVILRSGPGPDYEQVASLSNGTSLDVQRRVSGKEDWVKAGINAGSTEALEGYVNLTSDLIRVNVSLTDLPLIYEFGPPLSEPKRFESRAVEALITFKWGDYGQLEEDQVYSIILVRNDLSDAEACYHWQTKLPEVAFKPADFGCTPGDYHWGVGIATKIGEKDGVTIWRDDSEFDERFPIGIGVPYSGKPSSDDGGGGGDDGTGTLPPTP